MFRKSLPKLSRKSLNPILMEKFFKAKKSLNEYKEYKDEKPGMENKDEKLSAEPRLHSLDFPLPPFVKAEEFARGFKQFLDSDQGAVYKQGVKNIIDSIIKVINSWAIGDIKKKKWIESLNDFYRKHFEEYLGGQYEYNKKMFTLYIDGIKELETLSQRITDPKINLSMRQAILNNLLNGTELHRCGPGTAGFIKDASELLGTQPEEIIEKIKHDVVIQLAKEKYKSLDVPPELVIGYETHYANYVAFHCADVIGFHSLPDDYFNFVKKNKGDELYGKCITELPKVLNLSVIISQLVNRFDLYELVSDLQAKLAELQKTEINPILLFTSYYEDKTQALQKTLDQFGLDAEWIVPSLFDLEFDDVISIKLKPHAYETLKFSLLNRLMIFGYLNPDLKLQIELPDGDKLFIITGPSNSELSYIEATNNERSYLSFNTYFNSLANEKKSECLDKIIQHARGNKAVLASVIELSAANESLYLRLLEQGLIDVKSRDQFNMTPMLVAASKGYLSVVKYLYQKYPDTVHDVYPLNGSSAIHFAAEKGNPEIIDYLVSECHIPHDLANKEKCIPLIYAANANQVKVVEFLLNHYGDKQLNIRTIKGRSAFTLAKNYEIANLCLNENYIPNEYEISWIIQNAHKHAALYLKALKLNIINHDYRYSNGMTPLLTAAYFGYQDVVDYLIGHDKQVLSDQFENNSSSVIHFAAQGGNVNLIRSLVEEHKVDFVENNEGYTPFKFAFQNKHYEAIEYLLKRGFVPSVEDKVQILKLAKSDEAMLLKSLELNLIDASSRDPDGFTPMLIAIQKNYHKTISYLMSKFKDSLNDTFSNGSTVLHFAAEAGNLSLVKSLIEDFKVPATTCNKSGFTAALFASAQGHVEVLKYLVEECKLPYDEIDKDGCSALHGAVTKGQEEMVSYLLNKNNIDFINYRSNDGVTALTCAIKKKYWDSVKALLKAGALIDSNESRYIIESIKLNKQLFSDFILLGIINQKSLIDEKSAILYAALNNFPETVTQLSKNPNIPMSEKTQALTLLLKGCSDYKAIDELLQLGIPLSRDAVINSDRSELNTKCRLLLAIDKLVGEEKSSRDLYLTELRVRVVTTNPFDKETFSKEASIFEQEINRFNEVDGYVQKFERVITSNPDLEASIKDLAKAIFDNAFAILKETQSVSKALDDLRKKFRKLMHEFPNLGQIKSKSYQSFFSSKTIKQCFDDVLNEIDKQLPKEFANLDQIELK